MVFVSCVFVRTFLLFVMEDSDGAGSVLWGYFSCGLDSGCRVYVGAVDGALFLGRWRSVCWFGFAVVFGWVAWSFRGTVVGSSSVSFVLISCGCVFCLGVGCACLVCVFGWSLCA